MVMDKTDRKRLTTEEKRRFFFLPQTVPNRHWRRTILLMLCVCACAPILATTAGDTISVTRRLHSFMRNITTFNSLFPQEKVYLHLDNTGYFIGETIWFKAYVLRTDRETATDISRVLYVELVQPGGEVLKTCKLRIENGQADGCFKLDDAYLLSGFYEIRAYTRYMTNWDHRGIFSAVLPVFKKPEREGDYSRKQIDRLNYYRELPDYREQDSTQTGSGGVHIGFYPEGGKAVCGLPCRMAFRITDNGLPTDTVAYLMNEEGTVEDTVTTEREGRGLFSYTPDGSARYLCLSPRSGRKAERFRLPDAEAEGCVMSVDAISHPDTIGVRILSLTKDTLGLTLMHSGKIIYGDVTEVSPGSGLTLAFPRRMLPGGVSQFTLFDRKGEILSERLVFVRPDPQPADTIRIAPLTTTLYPCCPVRLTVTALPQTTFSFSATDVASATGGRSMNPQAWLMLASEIGGYVHRPEFYFESDDTEHRRAADLLMMVQGWRRYDWRTMSGNATFKVEQPVEDRLYLFGRLNRKWRWNPVDGVKLSAYLYNSQGASLTGHTVTDSTGFYAFSLPDIYGEWNMMLKTQKGGKNKSYYMAINRHFSPPLRSVTAEETVQTPPTEANLTIRRDSTGLSDTPLLPSRDIIAMPEVQVKEKRPFENARAAWENEISGAHVSYVHYDCDKESDRMADRGEEIPAFEDWLDEKNPFFSYDWGIRGDRQWWYKGRPVHWVLNNNSSNADMFPVFLDEVKSIHICDDLTTWRKYGGKELYGITPVTVFLYTHHKFLRNVKGLRRTHFQGYNVPSTFEMNDYSVLPPMEDFRRTLFWAPDVTTDQNGKAAIEFYNNSSCSDIHVSAEAITPDGHCIFNE